ncbi:hypothetical protein [Lacipirellula parvula]|uniref:Uncharacterized protein n=1 Tax=Lacipirellula parvula TaxID=2650471 RepID=A0A5K7XJN9_9BACT|nr:hypothetical protein [Lacipirellula parvula]BBO34453.1 hypothetical protein PLANPX_4065 [Lacipirellula parvula]
MNIQKALSERGVQPVPAPRRKRARQKETLSAFAELILTAFHEGNDCPLRDLADAVGQHRTNAVATACGAGVGGKGGGNFWMEHGVVIRCRENAALAAEFLSEDAAQDLVGSLGVDFDDFIDSMLSLPSLSPACDASGA